MRGLFFQLLSFLKKTMVNFTLVTCFFNWSFIYFPIFPQYYWSVFSSKKDMVKNNPDYSNYFIF